MQDMIKTPDQQSTAQMITALQTENAVLREELALVQEQLEWLKKQVFGRKTEQTSVIMDGGTQLSMFSEGQEQFAPQQEETITVPSHKRKKKRTHDDWMSELSIEEIVHEEEQPVCKKCGSEMKEIGKEKAFDELVYTLAKFHVHRHIVKVYKCTNCGEHPENDMQHEDDIEHCNIRRAACPKPMIPRSFCSPELLAHIVYEKYGKAVPLHRQEKNLSSKGIPLLKATMSNWVGAAAEQWCVPIVEKMQELMLAGRLFMQTKRQYRYCMRKAESRQRYQECGYTATVK